MAGVQSGKKLSKRDNPKKRHRHNSATTAEIGSFLSVWQQWRWLGKCTHRPGMKGRSRKLFYRAIQRGSETVEIGECVVLISSSHDLKFIGRIISLWESWDGGMYVRVKWFYHPEVTKGGKRLLETKRALYQSSHEDENDVQTISHKCDIMSYTDYQHYLQSSGGRPLTKQSPSLSSPSLSVRDVYYLAGTYDPITHQLAFEKDVKLAY
jgi:hypothetical protein